MKCSSVSTALSPTCLHTAYRWCPAGITEGFLVTGVIVECLKQEGANDEDQCEDGAHDLGVSLDQMGESVAGGGGEAATLSANHQHECQFFTVLIIFSKDKVVKS